MQRLRSRLIVRSLLERSRGVCTSSDKIVASVLFERLRVVIPKPDPAVYTFQEFKFNWQQQFRRRYPDEFLDIAKNRCLITEPRVNTKWTMYLLLELQRLTRITIGMRRISSEVSLRRPHSHIYFVGNAPMAHMVLQPTEETPDLQSYKVFVAASKYNISNCQDFVWVTKDELLEFFPEQAEFFNKMIIS